MSDDLVSHFRAMSRNSAWSNHRLHEACAKLSADDYAAQQIGFFPSIQRTLDHILVVDRLYLDALERRPRPHTAYGDALRLPFAELRAAQAAEDKRLIGFCDALREADLQAPVELPRAVGNTRDTVGAVLPHLFVHQVHHRGQAHAMLAGTSVAPPQLDEYFLAEDAPRRRADLIALGLEPS